MPSRLPYSKILEFEDFAHPDLRPIIRDVYSFHIPDWGDDFPARREYSKNWEVAMAVRSLADFGCVNPKAEILGVAAGVELTIFWLTREVGRVFATDLYLEPDEWERTKPPEILIDPASIQPGFQWDPRRLVTQHMNALDLRYEDCSFDGAFSSSSVEHFGSLEEMRRSASEICRVLKPGGVAAISTAMRIDGPAVAFPGLFLFDAPTLVECMVEGLDWELVGPLHHETSPATLDVIVPFEEASNDIARGIYWTTWPQIVLSFQDTVFTSVHVTMVKS